MPRQERDRRIRAKDRRVRRGLPARDYDPMRRNIIKLGLIGAGLVTVGGISYLLKEASESGSDEEIILGEAKRLGIHPSLEEKSLWASSHLNINTYIPPTTKNYEMARERALDTLDRMSKSKNPYFKQASDDLLVMVRSGNVRLVWLTPSQESYGASGGVGYGVNSDGQFDYEFKISPNFVLNQSSGLTLAGVHVHEVAHLKRFEEYRFLVSSLLPAEQVAKLDQHFNRREHKEVEEAFAHGLGAEAYIYQAGLLGSLYDIEGSGQEDRAEKYIRFGKDVDSPEWRNYLVRIGSVRHSYR